MQVIETKTSEFELTYTISYDPPLIVPGGKVTDEVYLILAEVTLTETFKSTERGFDFSLSQDVKIKHLLEINKETKTETKRSLGYIAFKHKKNFLGLQESVVKDFVTLALQQKYQQDSICAVVLGKMTKAA